jgi:ABC-type nickel/cobalt efflux system permease component RcnA
MSLNVLVLTAVTLGLTHTLIGPDHYLPFIVLGRAEGWPLRKALWWTVICGVAHVLSSVVLGLAGVGLGIAVSRLESLEGVRGTLASYALIGFGLLYFAWGIWRARRGGGHSHLHRHTDGTVHAHPHQHEEDRIAHEQAKHAQIAHEEPDHVTAHRRTVWALFIVFALGPCEPLIPLLMVPASEHSIWGVVLVAGVFGGVTVVTMSLMVTLGLLGLRSFRFRSLERYVHAMAGLTLFVSGILIQLLGI